MSHQKKKAPIQDQMAIISQVVGFGKSQREELSWLSVNMTKYKQVITTNIRNS